MTVTTLGRTFFATPASDWGPVGRGGRRLGRGASAAPTRADATLTAKT